MSSDREHSARAPLPSLYASWLAEARGRVPAREVAATCDDCPMVSGPGDVGFAPETKCCTYRPAVPNFLLGLVLADHSKALAPGRARVIEVLDSGVAVTPLGLGVPRPYSLLYDHSKDAFGKAKRLRCPFFLGDRGGTCGIWPYRTSICATWHCKHNRGARGERSWLMVNNLLTAVERTLALWCVLQHDIDDRAVISLLPPQVMWQAPPALTASQLDGVVEPAESRQVWGDWRGREDEFFERCAAMVSRLSWGDVVAVGGPDVAAWARFVRADAEKLGSAVLPRALVVNAFKVVAADAETVRVVGYSDHDPLELPRALVDVLHFFDGGDVGAARDAIVKATGLEVEDRQIRSLVDHRILVPPT